MSTWGGGLDSEPTRGQEPPGQQPKRRLVTGWTIIVIALVLIALVLAVVAYRFLTLVHGPAQSTSAPVTGASQLPGVGGASGNAGPIEEDSGYVRTNGDVCSSAAANVKLRIWWEVDSQGNILGAKSQLYSFSDSGLPIAPWHQSSAPFTSQGDGFTWRLGGVQVTGAVVYNWAAATPTFYSKFGDGTVKLTPPSWPPREIDICGRAARAD